MILRLLFVIPALLALMVAYKALWFIRPFHIPIWAIWLVVLVLGLLETAIYRGLFHNRSVTDQQSQPSSSRLARSARLLASANFLCLAMLFCAAAFNSSRAFSSTTTFILFHGSFFIALLVLCAVLSALLMAGLLLSVGRDLAEQRLIGVLAAWLLILHLIAFGAYTTIWFQREPLWRIEKTLQAADKQTYSLLVATTFMGNGCSALARHTASNPLFDTMHIIIADRSSSYPGEVIDLGKKHKNPNVRQISKALQEGL